MTILSAASDTVRVGSERDNKGSRFSTEFEIEEMEGDFTRNVKIIKETIISRMVNGVEKQSVIRKMADEKQSFTKGYMLYYPQAHSIFVAADDIEQLRQLGVPLDENDEVVLERQQEFGVLGLTAKEAVMKASTRRSKSTVGGIAEAMRG